MANIDNAFRVEKISLNDSVLITEGTSDPSTGGGYEAPVGSLFLYSSTGNVYRKFGTNDTDWTLFISEPFTLNSLSDVTISSPSTGQTLIYNGSQWVNQTAGTTDQLVKITSSDTTAGYLQQKISAGPNISLSVQNPGANETLQISATDQFTGTVTSVATTAPTAGFTISGSPIITSGTFVFTLANDLAGLEALSATGIPVRTATDTWTLRNIVSGTGISITNGSGVAGNPTISLNAGLDDLTDVVLTTPTNGQGLVYNGTNWVNSSIGTVTSVVASGSTGLTVGGSPITTAGTITLTLDTGLQNLSTLNTTGYVVATGTDTWTTRTIGSSSTGLTVTNGTGVSGNTSLALDAGLENLATLNTTGVVVATATDSWITRTITNGTGISVTNGTGVAGNPTISLNAGLDDLTDVVLTSPVNGQLLQYNGTNWVNINGGAGTGTVTSVAASGSTGLTVGGSPITTAGTITLTLDTGLQNLSTLNTTGYVVATGTDTWTTRTITAGTGISITNGTGVSGNTSVALNAALNDLTDVTITSPADDNLLAYDSGTSQWINVPYIVPPSGSNVIIQIKWNSIPAASGTTNISLATAAPTTAQGTQIWTDTINIQKNTSTIKVSCDVVISSSTNSMEFAVVIFRGTTAIGATLNTTGNNTAGHNISFVVYDSPATTGNVTYSCRVGRAGGSGTWYINQRTGFTPLWGGLLEKNAYTIEEIGTL